jgi:hypothetical protein
MTGPTLSDALRLVADHLPAEDPPDALAALAWRLDQRAAAADLVIDRMSRDLALHRALPLNEVRLSYGLPLLPTEPAQEPVRA